MDRTVSPGPKYFSVPKVGVVVRRIATAVVCYKSHDSRTSVESIQLKVWLEAWGLRKLQHPLSAPTERGSPGAGANSAGSKYTSQFPPPLFMWRGI